LSERICNEDAVQTMFWQSQAFLTKKQTKQKKEDFSQVRSKKNFKIRV